MMKMAMLVKSRGDMGIYPEEKALRFFDCLLNSCSGQELYPEDQAFLDSAMRAKGHNMVRQEWRKGGPVSRRSSGTHKLIRYQRNGIARLSRAVRQA